MKVQKIALASLIAALMIAQPVFAAPPAPADNYRQEGIRIGGGDLQDAKGMRLGKATLKAQFDAEGQLDSNVYWTPEDKKTDYLFVLRPKALLDVPFGIDERHLLQLMYTGEGGLFANQTKQNYYNQTGAANLNMRMSSGYLNVNEAFTATSDRAGTEFTQRIDRYENRAGATVGVEINKLTFEAGYTNFFKRYLESPYTKLNYVENILRGTAFYQLFPKTKVLLDYTFGLLDYYNDGSRDGYYNQVVTGVKGELTGKTTGIAKAGFQQRDYDANDGYIGFVGELGLVSRLTDRTQLTVKYATTPVESTYENNNYYTENMFGMELDQKLMGKLSLLLNSSFSYNRYPEEDSVSLKKRRDFIITEGAGLKYSLKDWGRIYLGYQYKQRASNVGSQRYNDHLFTTRFSLLY
ncbi:MAG: outer membrane beta-barrel protein [Candidatus Omnitrophica bacterium]|nr:outer membrane beta-barrel protein [Candidatus Omnitrophota bacterium]